MNSESYATIEDLFEESGFVHISEKDAESWLLANDNELKKTRLIKEKDKTVVARHRNPK